jgi:HPt (histidine-containing phosphotransfer) domain-containing protein
VAALWERFRGAILDRVGVLERPVSALEHGPLNPKLRAAAVSEAHKLTGSAGTFGFAEGSRLARLLEEAFQADPPVGSADAPRLTAWVNSLRTELEGAPAGGERRASKAMRQPHLLVVGRQQHWRNACVPRPPNGGSRAYSLRG